LHSGPCAGGCATTSITVGDACLNFLEKLLLFPGVFCENSRRQPVFAPVRKSDGFIKGIHLGYRENRREEFILKHGRVPGQPVDDRWLDKVAMNAFII